MYLRNAWNVAADGAEVTGALRSIRIMGEDIADYRKENGEPAALEDSCPRNAVLTGRGRRGGGARRSRP